MAKPALGRGLGALLSGGTAAKEALEAPVAPVAAPSLSPAASAPGGVTVQRVALERIRPCPFQPRKDFSDESLRELADSIQQQGIVQPLVVRQRGEYFELIAGERRWRAAHVAGLTDAPVVVREADDRTVLQLALIENLQRENLNPMEEALGYSQLLEQFHLTQEEAASRVGKSRAAVANALRLLKLPANVQGDVRAGRLPVGHAKVILGLGRMEDQVKAAERVIRDGLSVRETELLVAEWNARPGPRRSGELAGAAGNRDPHVLDLESRLKQKLGTKVGLKYRAGKGAIQVHFFSEDELERILQLLGISLD